MTTTKVNVLQVKQERNGEIKAIESKLVGQSYDIELAKNGFCNSNELDDAIASDYNIISGKYPIILITDEYEIAMVNEVTSYKWQKHAQLNKISEMIGSAVGEVFGNFILAQPNGSVLNLSIGTPKMNFTVTNNNGNLKIE